jgi:hypothetical protein
MEEELAICLRGVPQKGKPRRSPVKATAVHQARELLLRFGSKQPSLYRDGAWHKLAKVIFGGHDRTDLFDYLERYSPPGPSFEYYPTTGWREAIEDEPSLWWLARMVGRIVGGRRRS